MSSSAVNGERTFLQPAAKNEEDEEVTFLQRTLSAGPGPEKVEAVVDGETGLYQLGSADSLVAGPAEDAL